MIHELKCWPKFFDASWAGHKPFEIRIDDRDYRIGDSVILREYDPESKKYSGREIDGTIRYVSTVFCKPGYVAFTFDEFKRRKH